MTTLDEQLGPEVVTAYPSHAISIRQPWADAILYEGKDYENRT